MNCRGAAIFLTRLPFPQSLDYCRAALKSLTRGRLGIDNRRNAPVINGGR
jgi:hypothetical protein